MNIHYASAEDAEEAFYEAIGRGDIDALMSVWADDEEIVCIHPTGQRLSGAAAIRESWRAIFANNPHITVHIQHSVHWKSMMLDVHSVIETLYLADEATPHGPMLSTNVFQRGANGWRMLSHHSSASSTGDTEHPAEHHNDSPRTLH